MDIFVGSYGVGDNQSVYHYEVSDLGFKLISSTNLIDNPSYLALSPDKKHIFCVSETETYQGEYGGAVCILKYENNEFTLFDSKGTQGAAPCHLRLKDNCIFVSNYLGGSVSVLKINEEVNQLEMCDFVKHTGSSINVQRQEAPHVHFCDFVGGELWAADLGTDTIMRYGVKGDKLEFLGQIDCDKGSGVRHFVVNENGTVFAICELSSEIIVIEDRKIVERISTIAEGGGENIGSAIKIYKDLIFASNRGHNTIALYQITNERLTLIDTIATMGKTPRDFLVCDDYLVVANQDSNQLELFQFDYATKTVSHTGKHVACTQPVCIIR